MAKGWTKGRICDVRDCGQKHYSSGYCTKHYQRYKAHGSAEAVPYRSFTTNLTGQMFGKLQVIGLAPPQGKKVMWLCRCQCGQFTIVPFSNLGDGHTKSCGCLLIEAPARRRIYQGRRSTEIPEYSIYLGAKQRCNDRNCRAYVHYGGRGIEFRFRSFKEFIQELGPRPSPIHSVNRIDNDGHYEPGNVEWATPREQMRNVRTNRIIKYRGESYPLVVWAERVGLKSSALRDRLGRGWCVACSLSIPSGGGKCFHTASALTRSTAMAEYLQEKK